MSEATIETGDPVILVDASGLEETGLTNNTVGWANSVTTVPGNGTYVFFMREDSKQVFVLGIDRLVLDEDAKAAGLELNQDTIAKG